MEDNSSAPLISSFALHRVMGDPSLATTDTDTALETHERAQFSLGELLLWMAGASVGLAATYWLGSCGAALAMLLLVGYLPYRLGLCTLFESTAIAMALAAIIVVFFPIPFVDNGHREAARRSACQNNLKLIGLALVNYHDHYGTLPPAYIADVKGKPIHSWRVLILPFMDQDAIFKRYRFDEPWDGPSNRLLQSEIVKAFHCPSSGNYSDGTTSYLAVVGPKTAWRGQATVSLDDISDVEDETLLVVEVHDSGIH